MQGPAFELDWWCCWQGSASPGGQIHAGKNSDIPSCTNSLWLVDEGGRDCLPYFALVRPCLKQHIHFWHSNKKGVDKLKQVQWRFTKVLRVGEFVLWGETEGCGLVQFGREVILVGPNGNSLVLTRQAVRLSQNLHSAMWQESKTQQTQNQGGKRGSDQLQRYISSGAGMVRDGAISICGGCQDLTETLWVCCWPFFKQQDWSGDPTRPFAPRLSVIL